RRRRPPRRDALGGDRRVPQPDGRPREARRPPRRAGAAARPAPPVRPGRRGARAARTPRAGARRRAVRPLAPHARRRQPARTAAHGLREGAPLGPVGRARAVAFRRGGLRRRLMATTDRDYYELLGVPRDADEATIKKAFRRLARQLD